MPATTNDEQLILDENTGLLCVNDFWGVSCSGKGVLCEKFRPDREMELENMYCKITRALLFRENMKA